MLEVLHLRPGDNFDTGLINGPRGKATLQAVENDRLILTHAWGDPPPPLAPIRLIIGLPRPQTARDILREGATLGVAAMDFVRTEKTDPGYARSSLWVSPAWEYLLLAGAAQAFCTRIPVVRHGHALTEAITALPADCVRIALDNYESPGALSGLTLDPGASVTLALGPERGWSLADRDLLRAHGFRFAHLGDRVLRTETACISAVTLLKAKLGLL